MDPQTDTAIAKGKVLAYLLLNRQPVAFSVSVLADKLQLTPALITGALRELEAEDRATVVIAKAIVTLIEPPELPTSAGSAQRPESEAETLVEKIRGAKP